MELISGGMKVGWLDGVIPPMHLLTLVSYYLHGGHGVYTGTSQVRTRGMAEIVNCQSPALTSARNSSPPTRCSKSSSRVLPWPPFIQEHPTSVQATVHP